MKKININKWLRILVSFALIAFIITKIDIHKLAALIRSLQLSFIYLIIPVVALERVIVIYRWNLLLRAKGIAVSFAKAMWFFLVSEFTGFFLPTAIGSDVIRALSFGKYASNHTDTASSIFVDRFLSTASLIIITLLSISLSHNLISNTAITVSVLASALVFILISAVLSSRALYSKVSRLFSFIKIAPVKQSLARLYNSLHLYQKNKGILLIALLLSFSVQFIRILIIYLLGQALHLRLPFYTCFLLSPLILFVSSLPISVSGLGVREGAFVYFFSKVNISADAAFTASLLFFTIGVLTALPGGIIYAFAGLPGKHKTINVHPLSSKKERSTP